MDEIFCRLDTRKVKDYSVKFSNPSLFLAYRLDHYVDFDAIQSENHFDVDSAKVLPPLGMILAS